MHIERFFFLRSSSSLNSKTSLILCWNISKFSELLMIMSKEEQPTDISRPSPIRCIISVISRQVHFNFSLIDNKINLICWPQTFNMRRALHSFLFCKKYLKIINNERMNHKNVPSFPEIKYCWWSPCCIDPTEEIHASFDCQILTEFLLALSLTA